MTMTVETALVNNQSILQNFGLVEEIDEQAAEIISGGAERFSIRNRTNQDIYYTIDGVVGVIKPGQSQRFRTEMGGQIRFDKDIRENRVRTRGYNLSDGKTYEFRILRNNADFVDLYRR
jgi:hypothetical protein